MNKRLVASLAAIAPILLGAAPFAHAADSALAAEMRECLRRHGLLMDKPALRNEQRCWQAHGRLIDRG